MPRHAEMTAFYRPRNRSGLVQTAPSGWGVTATRPFRAGDYERFIRQYILPSMQTSGWAIEDFGKPGLEKANPISQVWIPEVNACLPQRTTISFPVFSFSLNLTRMRGKIRRSCQETWISYTISEDNPEIFVDLQWFNKSPCRCRRLSGSGLCP